MFEGFPIVKIEMVQGQVLTLNLSSAESASNRVRIVKRGERYFWATRQNTELIRIEGIGVITYLSPEGHGYVRTLTPLMMELYKHLPPAEKQKYFLFIEHATFGIGAVTYFGR